MTLLGIHPGPHGQRSRCIWGDSRAMIAAVEKYTLRRNEQAQALEYWFAADKETSC